MQAYFNKSILYTTISFPNFSESKNNSTKRISEMDSMDCEPTKSNEKSESDSKIYKTSHITLNQHEFGLFKKVNSFEIKGTSSKPLVIDADSYRIIISQALGKAGFEFAKQDYESAYTNLLIAAQKINEVIQKMFAKDESKADAEEIKKMALAVLNNLGIVSYNLKKYDESIYYFRESIKLSESIKLYYFKESIKLKPDNLVAYRGLSSALLHKNQFEDAINYCGKTFELDPNDRIAIENIGCATISKSIGYLAFPNSETLPFDSTNY